MMKLKKPFNPDVLYNYIVHYYIDKKGVTKEDANKIAHNVISKELQRHIVCVQNLLKMYNQSEEFQFGIN